MRRALIVLALLSRIAAADSADWHARAFAEESTTSQVTWTEFAAGGGFEVAATAPECDLVKLGGSGRFVESADGEGAIRGASAETWASACLHVWPMTFQIGHHLEWDVRPGLLAPLGLQRGDNRRETVTINFEPARIAASRFVNPGATGDVVIFAVDTAFAFTWQRGGVPALVASAEAAGFRYARGRLIADVFSGGGQFTDDSATVGFWGLRVQHAHLGALDTSAGIGLASLSAGPFVTMTTRQIDVTVPRVLLAIGAGDETTHAELRATEDTQLLPDGTGAIDQRLTGTASAVIERHHMQFDASIGRTDLRIPDAMPVRAITGGATLAFTSKISRHTELAESLTYARSFYAATATPTDPTWGLQAFVSLRAAIDLRGASGAAEVHR